MGASNLSRCYRMGRGVKKSNVEMFKWQKLAVEYGQLSGKFSNCNGQIIFKTKSIWLIPIYKEKALKRM